MKSHFYLKDDCFDFKMNFIFSFALHFQIHSHNGIVVPLLTFATSNMALSSVSVFAIQSLMLTVTAFVSFDPISDYSASSCEHIITGSLTNSSEFVTVDFELNSTEFVWISTCASSFNTSFELHREDSDLVLHSIGIYDDCSFAGRLHDEPSITTKMDASIQSSLCPRNRVVHSTS